MRKIYLFHIVHLLLHSCRIIMGNQAQNNRNDNNGIERIADKLQETAMIVSGNSIKTNDDGNVGTEIQSYVDGTVESVTDYTLPRPTSTFSTYLNTLTVDSTALINVTTVAPNKVVTKQPQNSPKKHLPKIQRTDAPMLNYIFDSISSANKHHHHDHRYGPHFEDISSAGNVTNITVQVGSAVYLNCRISLLQDKTVSWVRRKSGETHLDLLTVGMHTYSGDTRYKMEFQYPNNWKLKIESTVKEDEGSYFCQISTHPPRVIQKNLYVNDPKVLIIDEKGIPLQDKYYEVDSTMQLSCIVRHVAMSTSVVYWSHGDRILNYDTNRGGVSVKTEIMEKGANSTLLIAKINKSDSGNYSCSIPNSTHDFTVLVHVLNESFAELHHGNSCKVIATGTRIFLLFIVVNLILWELNR
ncbi:uncharacterized protein LOC119077788 isoform X2 [Bradysia coprophila]|uniref:uncharacterized protein LOC119077788 isoform X2 n=1 Tax=Bradysia coprophila TaxID=38358 RepID=UPI00187D769F|nr:uncharacterized protein LOC119077788 isoform X2 [Bradysia coprophila]